MSRLCFNVPRARGRSLRATGRVKRRLKLIPLATRFHSSGAASRFVLVHRNALVDLLNLRYVARESARRHRVSEREAVSQPIECICLSAHVCMLVDGDEYPALVL
jgi:hypothetical protein